MAEGLPVDVELANALTTLSQSIMSPLEQITEGLWRWSAPHPEWVPNAEPDSPEDWGRDVGSVIYRHGQDAVFFDPLLPPDRDGFLADADRLVEGRAIYVLTTIRWHERDRDVIVERYSASTSEALANLPPGVRAFKAAGETLFWLEQPRTLICGDRIIGDENGGLRLCPESWLRYLDPPGTHERLREELRPLLELPVERVLVSHGEPVLEDAGRALLALLEEEDRG